MTNTAERELRRRRLRRHHSFGKVPMLFHRCLRVAAIVTVLVLVTFIKDFLLQDSDDVEEVELKNISANVIGSDSNSGSGTVTGKEQLRETHLPDRIQEKDDTNESIDPEEPEQKQEQPLVKPPSLASIPVSRPTDEPATNKRKENPIKPKPSNSPTHQPIKTSQPTRSDSSNAEPGEASATTAAKTTTLRNNTTLSKAASSKASTTKHTILKLNRSSFTETHFHLPSMLQDDPDHHLSQQQRDQFLSTYCFVEGTDWFPPDGSWKLRAPAAVFAGAHAAGISGLVKLLDATTSNQFFYQRSFGKFMTKSGKVRVWSARQRLWSRNFKPVQTSETRVSIDATEGYLFHSTTVPVRILCTCPWVKLIVMLRNPVDRVWGQYQEFKQNHNLKLSLEEWIAPDLKALREVGLIPDPNNTNSTVVDEDEAYALYLQIAQEGPIGHGLYEIQLRHWLGALQAMGRDLNTSVLILRFEEMKSSPNVILQHVTDFLGLPSLETTSIRRSLQLVDRGQASTAMDPDTRLELEAVFAPFNEKLYDMLGWQAVWKDESER
jgi:outer membrane biosynthesis protein TonB